MTADHGLRCRFRRGVGAITVDVSFDVAPGERLVVVGPNGAGKSTLLRVVAGLTSPDAGYVGLGDTAWFDDATDLPPEQRSVGFVPQDLLLFPHLDALDNVAFGLRASGLDRRSARRRAGEWLERLGIAEVSGRRPHALSGGQRQRVALARALALEPSVVLLDEPLSALDAQTRGDVRGVLAEHLGALPVPVVMVTHDPLDAMLLGHRLAVLEAGQIVQIDTPAQVASRPTTAYTARLVGLNLIAGTGLGTGVVETDHGNALWVPGAPTGPVHVAIRPSAVSLYLDAPQGSPRNVLTGSIVGVEPSGDLVRVGVAIPTLGQAPLLVDVTPAAVAALTLRPGLQVAAVIKAADTEVYPR